MCSAFTFNVRRALLQAHGVRRPACKDLLDLGHELASGDGEGGLRSVVTGASELAFWTEHISTLTHTWTHAHRVRQTEREAGEGARGRKGNAPDGWVEQDGFASGSGRIVHPPTDD